jgi:hypothetical protein
MTAPAKLLCCKPPVDHARSHERADFFSRTFRLQRPLRARFDTRAAMSAFCARAILSTSLMASSSRMSARTLHGEAKTSAFSRDAREAVRLL